MLQRLPQRCAGAVGIALGELQPPTCRHGRGRERRALEVGGDLLELVGGGVGGVEVAGRHRDLDPGREQLAAGEPVPRLLGEHPRDDGGGGVDAALGEAHERQPRALLAAQLLGAWRTPPRRRRGRRAADGSRRSRRSRPRRCGTWKPSSSTHACRASRSAAGQSPRSWRSAAWCTRQMPGHMASGCSSDQRSVASVHSAARRRSPSCSQALIRLQYTLPVVNGLSRPSTADSIASSRWPSPSARSPASMRSRPIVCSASASRSADGSRRRQRQRVAGQRRRLVEVAGAVGDLGLAEEEVAERDRLGLGLERPAGPPQPPAGDRRAGLELVVLPQPHRALARRAADRRGRRTARRPARGRSMQSSRRPSHHDASATMSRRSASARPATGRPAAGAASSASVQCPASARGRSSGPPPAVVGWSGTGHPVGPVDHRTARRPLSRRAASTGGRAPAGSRRSG